MNKRGQPQSIGALILWACGFLVFCVIIGGAFSYLRLQSCPTCQTCNYSSYEKNISECINYSTNLSTALKERPIEYIQNITYVPEYKDLPKADIISSVIIILSSIFIIFFFSFKLHLFKIDHLFKIEIKDLSEEWKKELERLKEEFHKLKTSLKVAKWIIIAFAVVVAIKTIILLFAI
jgi:hypothetical protein